MRTVRLALVILLGATASSSAAAHASASGADVIREMNLAREHPQVYAGLIEQLRSHFRGDLLVVGGRPALRTREGVHALDEAIRFLRRSRPLPALVGAPGMNHAAAEHVDDQANGGFGHAGLGGSMPGQRINRHGNWSGSWGENVAYGQRDAREIVMTLIIDDGLRSRKHRKNIFNAAFRYAGAAVGPHATYGACCTIDFAAGFTDRNSSPGNFGYRFAASTF